MSVCVCVSDWGGREDAETNGPDRVARLGRLPGLPHLPGSMALRKGFPSLMTVALRRIA